MYNLAKESQYKLQAEIAVILNEYISNWCYHIESDQFNSI